MSENDSMPKKARGSKHQEQHLEEDGRQQKPVVADKIVPCGTVFPEAYDECHDEYPEDALACQHVEDAAAQSHDSRHQVETGDGGPFLRAW